MEKVLVPIVDKNKQAQSYTYLKINTPYIALNSQTYISLRTQDLATCTKIGYEFYCEELSVVKHKTKYNCESAIYFDLDAETIKENCEFQYYFNMTDMTPAVLDKGHENVFANWPDNKHVICNDNSNIPIKIPSHHYVLINISLMQLWNRSRRQFLIRINSYVSWQTIRFGYVLYS